MNLRRFIWVIYRYKSFTYFVFYVVGLILMSITYYSFGAKPSITEIIIYLYQKSIENIKSTFGVIIFFLIPSIFPILGKYLIQNILIRFSAIKGLDKLYDHPWELAELECKFIRAKLQKIVAEVQGFNTGLQRNTTETEYICNELYHLTHAKKVSATCLRKSAYHMYSKRELKSLLDTTMGTIVRLNKINFLRYFISTQHFNKLFNDTPSEAIKWFVRLHNHKNVELYYICLTDYYKLCVQSGVPLDCIDALFFHSSIVVSLQTDPKRNHQVKSSSDGKNTLFIINSEETIRAYDRLFTTVKTQSVNILETIRMNKWNGAYFK